MALLPFIGHVISVVMLLSAAYTIKLIDWLTRFFVNIVKSLTDADIEKDRRTWHPQREISDIVYTGYSLSECFILYVRKLYVVSLIFQKNNEEISLST